MKHIRVLQISESAPSTESIWLYKGAARYFSNGEWKNIGGGNENAPSEDIKNKTVIPSTTQGIFNDKITSGELPSGSVWMVSGMNTFYRQNVTVPVIVNSDFTYTKITTSEELQAHADHDANMFNDLVAQIQTASFTQEQIQAIVNSAITMAGSDVVTKTYITNLLGSYATDAEVSLQNSNNLTLIQDNIDSRFSEYDAQNQTTMSDMSDALTGSVNQVEQELTNHITTDKSRWDDTYEFELEAIDSIINSKGMVRDVGNNVDVSVNNIGTPYIVTDELGGLLSVTITNDNATYGEIYINGILRYSTNGFVSGAVTTKYYPVKLNDTIYVTNAQSATFTPYVVDINSQIHQMYLSIDSLLATVLSLQNQINDQDASISNKTIAGVDPIDITNTTYTVDNTLGARVTGQGDKVLGLLGITIASTGIVKFNGVEKYNNTALLSGEAPVLSINVPNGTIIESSAMSYVTIYNYVST